MFKYNFIYELKLLIRSQWIQVLSILLLVLFGFAVFNGQQKAKKRQADISKVQQQVKTSDETMLKLLDSVEQGLEVSVPRWRLPNSPMTIGNNYPRLTHMSPHHWTFISTGQSDMYAHYVKPTVRGNDFELSFTEMTSPTQLLFGSFDLAFVIVYLLPLIIIAFSFNVLSNERESGSLKLLASQPISIKTWVLQKLGLRFLWLAVIVLITISIVFILNALNPFAEIMTFLGLLGVIFSYMLFWFALAFLTNITGMNSAKNALSLIGLWILFVLLLPTVVNQLGNSMYPMPSRNVMVNEMRTIKAEAIKRQDEILDNYLRDHPEFAINDKTQDRSFWHRYMASQELIKEELHPIISSYDVQLRKQQEWLEQLKWISPAMSVQETLNHMAGTSTVDYENFRTQVVTFSETWRSHLIPFLYNNQEFSKSDYDTLPQFKYEQKSYSSVGTISILLGITLLIFGVGFFASGNLKHKTILKGS